MNDINEQKALSRGIICIQKKVKRPHSSFFRRLLKTAGIMRFLSHFDKRIEFVGFDAYIRKLCASKGIIPKLVIQKAGITPQYGQRIFGGKCRPKRDMVIRLAFGFELDYKEAQLLLQAAGKKELNRKIRRDAAVVYALTRKSSLEDLQIILKELQLPLFDN